ncbi:MAG: DUF6152 family protein [Sphingomonadales bacterium]
MGNRWLAPVAALAFAAPAAAHHSFAMFDMTKTVTVNGTIVEFKWTNPHAWMHVDIADPAGKVSTWAIEMTSPNNLVRSGWRRSSLKPGDKVSVQIHPLRNGKMGGSLVQVTLPGGQVLKNS